jgi:hypothetical protein
VASKLNDLYSGSGNVPHLDRPEKFLQSSKSNMYHGASSVNNGVTNNGVYGDDGDLISGQQVRRVPSASSRSGGGGGGALTGSAFEGSHGEGYASQIPRLPHSEIPYVRDSLRALTLCQYLAALGCKRVVRDQGYLESLSHPNVRLTFDLNKHVIPDGVMTETGMYVPPNRRQRLMDLAFSRRTG